MSKTDQAFARLGLSPAATPSEVKLKWRKLCAQLHPDRGGNPVEFDETRRAYKLAFETASAPKPCSACNGTGQVKRVNGFSTIALVCVTCGGAGHAIRAQ